MVLVKEYLDYYYNDDMDKVEEYNRELISEYPFLYYDPSYKYSLLDCMEPGWRIAFSEDFLKELKEELVKHNCLDTYCVTQIKEKYGELRWYSMGYTEDCKVEEIVDKYSKLSKTICASCGKEAKYSPRSYQYPLCEDCAKTEYKLFTNKPPFDKLFIKIRKEN